MFYEKVGDNMVNDLDKKDSKYMYIYKTIYTLSVSSNFEARTTFLF